MAICSSGHLVIAMDWVSDNKERRGDHHALLHIRRWRCSFVCCTTRALLPSKHWKVSYSSFVDLKNLKRYRPLESRRVNLRLSCLGLGITKSSLRHIEFHSGQWKIKWLFLQVWDSVDFPMIREGEAFHYLRLPWIEFLTTENGGGIITLFYTHSTWQA